MDQNLNGHPFSGLLGALADNNGLFLKPYRPLIRLSGAQQWPMSHFARISVLGRPLPMRGEVDEAGKS